MVWEAQQSCTGSILLSDLSKGGRRPQQKVLIIYFAEMILGSGSL